VAPSRRRPCWQLVAGALSADLAPS